MIPLYLQKGCDVTVNFYSYVSEFYESNQYFELVMGCLVNLLINRHFFLQENV
jgi:hypothetical protein